mgnify:CR=1 FL=1
MKRLDYYNTAPQAMDILMQQESYFRRQFEASETMSVRIWELVKLRVSQINQCAFCIDMHTKEAIKLGETHERLFLLDAWKDVDVFTEEEKVILQMTEEITKIHEKGLTDETYQKAMKFFDPHYFSQIIMAIATINVWNRIAISTHTPVPN